LTWFKIEICPITPSPYIVTNDFSDHIKDIFVNLLSDARILLPDEMPGTFFFTRLKKKKVAIFTTISQGFCWASLTSK
jgi:hypothetical protein